jgi:murein DD-endopeptidase MepM/ murein hydrolase activator NlpD
MSHITKYGRRMVLTLLLAMTVAVFICFFSIPFAEKRLLSNKVGYYSVWIGGEYAGTANSRQDAADALAEARKRVSSQYSAMVYMNPVYEVKKETGMFAQRMTVDELAGALYGRLLSDMTDRQSELSYVVSMDDSTVTLATLDDVRTLLERFEQQYDQHKEYEVQITEAEESGKYNVDIVKKESSSQSADIVSAILNGSSTVSEDGTVNYNEILEMSFVQKVTVNTALRSMEAPVSVDEAYQAVTAVSEEPRGYVVQSGDTLETIADAYEMSVESFLSYNSELTEDSILIPGDIVSVAYPKSVLQLQAVQKETADEEYSAEPQYVENEEESRGTNTVVTEGTAGERTVTEEVTYINGRRYGVKLTAQVVKKNAEAAVVSVGSAVGNEFVKPVAAAVSKDFEGINEGENNGLDWQVPTGTAVTAAAAGTVTRAGWYADEGFVIEIEHENDYVTRYTHLSAVNVIVGQLVKQSQEIGKSGATGSCTEPVLHFEMLYRQNYVNPSEFVSKK